VSILSVSILGRKVFGGFFIPVCRLISSQNLQQKCI
jgi:hypothetical protein